LAPSSHAIADGLRGAAEGAWSVPYCLAHGLRSASRLEARLNRLALPPANDRAGHAPAAALSARPVPLPSPMTRNFSQAACRAGGCSGWRGPPAVRLPRTRPPGNGFELGCALRSNPQQARFDSGAGPAGPPRVLFFACPVAVLLHPRRDEQAAADNPRPRSRRPWNHPRRRSPPPPHPVGAPSTFFARHVATPTKHNQGVATVFRRGVREPPAPPLAKSAASGFFANGLRAVFFRLAEPDGPSPETALLPSHRSRRTKPAPATRAYPDAAAARTPGTTDFFFFFREVDAAPLSAAP